MEPLKAQLQALFQRAQEAISSLGISVVLHVVLLALLLWAGTATIEKKPPAPKVPVIQAHAVDGQQLKAREERKRKEQEAKARKEREKREAAKRKKQQELKRKQEAKRKAEEKKRKAAEKKKAEKKKAEEKKRKAAEKKKAEKKRKEAERKKAAALKKKKAAEKKKAEEKKRKAAEKKKAEEKKRKAAEKKRAEEKRRKAEAERKQRELQMQLDAEMEAEQELIASSRRQSAVSRELSQLKSTIRQQIEQVWSKPLGTPVGRTCKVRVNLLPGGEVGRVTVLVSSGNEVFDASVEQAVRKAAPFPYPDSVELRNEVRELEMTFVHEG